MNKRKIGKEQEDRAVKYLTAQGYRVLTTNFYCNAGEIDIIAKDGDYLCFIEVKYRSNISSGYPEEAVDPRKAGRIARSALYYMNMAGYAEDTPCRFDVVSMLEDEIYIIKNAFDAAY